MDKRIIEETPSTEVFNDDWFIKDSPTNGTSKILGSDLKDAITGDVEDAIDKILSSIAPEWSSTFTYGYDAYVIYEGELWRCFKDTGSTRGEFKTSEWIKGITSGYISHVIDKIANRFVASNPPYMTYRYSVGDMVFYSEPYHDEQLYVCNTDLPQGESTFNPEHWDVVYTVAGLSKYLMDKIAEAGQIDDVQVKTTGDYESVVDENKVAKIDLSNILIEKSVPNLPQPIASFSDGADAVMQSLKVDIEPVQDLHGYDAPWVGGGGINKMPAAPQSSGTVNGLTYMSDGNGKYTISGTSAVGDTVTFYLEKNATLINGGKLSIFNNISGNINLFFNLDGEDQAYWSLSSASRTATITQADAKEFNRIKIIFYTAGSVNLSLSPMIYEGDTQTAFAPYSNICPISGWTEEVITKCGKNWFGSNENPQDNTYLKDDSETATATGWVLSDWIMVKPNTTYRFNPNTTEGNAAKHGYYDVNKNFISTINSGSRTFTTPSNCFFMRFSYRDTSDNIQLELGNQSTEYEPYAGTTTTIPFTDSQGNPVEVYGGSVDVVNGGEQPRTLNKVDLGSLNWSAISGPNGVFGATVNGLKTYNYGVVPDMLCSIYKTAPSSYNDPYISANGIIWTYVGVSAIRIKDTAYSDAEAFKASVTGQQLVYELATPTTFYTQPTSIKSLDGENNVFASTGDVAKLEYIANATDVIANLEARVTALENA